MQATREASDRRCEGRCPSRSPGYLRLEERSGKAREGFGKCCGVNIAARGHCDDRITIEFIAMKQRGGQGDGATRLQNDLEALKRKTILRIKSM